MAQTDIVMAGFGGQGLMAIGKMLAKAAMAEGQHVTWMPAYGPEMRGGTANCTVIIDDEPIGSPIVRRTQAAIVMNKQSMDKFEPTVREQGLIIVNTSLIDRKVERADLKAIYDKLVQADRTQELAKGSAKGATATRTARHVRVEAAMTRIVGVSGIVFRKRPEIAQRFADCLPRTARPRKKKA